jgi:hypothetical protein
MGLFKIDLQLGGLGEGARDFGVELRGAIARLHERENRRCGGFRRSRQRPGMESWLRHAQRRYIAGYALVDPRRAAAKE